MATVVSAQRQQQKQDRLEELTIDKQAPEDTGSKFLTQKSLPNNESIITENKEPDSAPPFKNSKQFKPTEQASEFEYYKEINDQKEVELDIVKEKNELVRQNTLDAIKEEDQKEDDDQENPLVKKHINTMWISKISGSKLKTCNRGKGIMKGNFEDDAVRNYPGFQDEEEPNNNDNPNQYSTATQEKFFTIEGPIINNNIQGFSIQKFQSRDRRDWPIMNVEIQADFINNYKNGEGSVYVDDQLVYEGNFINDVVHGRGRAYYLKKGIICTNDGIMSIGEHRRDKRFSYFFFDEKRYNAGCKVGLIYHKNGKMQRTGFLDDDFYHGNPNLKDNFVVNYHENGQILSIDDKNFSKRGVSVETIN